VLNGLRELGEPARKAMISGGFSSDIRARAIGLILASIGLKVDVQADRVDAKVQKLEASLLTEKLDIIGRLFRFTRQLDMLMTDENMVGVVARCFSEGKYNL